MLSTIKRYINFPYILYIIPYISIILYILQFQLIPLYANIMSKEFCRIWWKDTINIEATTQYKYRGVPHLNKMKLAE